MQPTEVVLPSDWFRGNAVRTELIWWRLITLSVSIGGLYMAVVHRHSTWIGGLFLVAIFASIYQLLRTMLQIREVRNNPGNWCFCYFGTPNEIYTSATNILVKAEFGGGVQIHGMKVDYVIPNSRITNIEGGNFLDSMPQRWGVRIDWRANSGGTNSLYLADFISDSRSHFDHWKVLMESPGNLEERLPRDVSWLPPKNFKMPIAGFVACAVSIMLTVVFVEVLHSQFKVFTSSGSHTFWLIAGNLLVLSSVFGFFINQYEEQALATARAAKEIEEGT